VQLSLLPVTLVVTALSSTTCAGEANSTSWRKTIAESADDVPRACTSPNCTTVIAVKQLDLYESPPLFGLYRITP